MSNSDIFSESFLIPSDTDGIRLHLLHKRRKGEQKFSEASTIVMMHGATYSSGSLFDTPLEGASFADALARAGFDVYAVDVRGYGGSTRPVEMLQAATLNAPAVRTDVAVRDFSSAINFVLRTNGLSQVNVIGMSWGGSVTGTYTTQNGHKVRRLGLIAPQWVSDKPLPLDPGGELNAWRIVNAGAARERWISGAPQCKRGGLIPEGGFEAWLEKTVSDEPDDALRAQQSIRASNGPIQDIRDYWATGKPFYDPADIGVPLMLIHGEWDIDVPVELAQAWFLRATGSPDKRWLEIGEATHMMVLEKNRYQIYNALISFFREPLAKA